MDATHHLDNVTRDVISAFLPIYPKRDTQAARLLALLLTGEIVNPLRACLKLGIDSLSDTKFHLKKRGWPFAPGSLNVTNMFVEGCHVALYSLAEWAIDATGESGRNFAQCEIEVMACTKTNLANSFGV